MGIFSRRAWTGRGRGRGRSLRLQLRVSFILISLIALLMSAILTYFGVLGILERKTNESSMQYFLQAGDSIHEFRQEIDKMSKQLLTDPIIQQFLDNKLFELPDKIQLHRDVIQELDAYMGNYEYLDSIYVYAEDGRIIGVTGDRTFVFNDEKKQEPYYASSFHHQVLQVKLDNSYPRIVWEGAHRKGDFGESSPLIKDEPRNLITAARAVKSLFQSLPSASLIINIREDKLFSLYNNLKSKLNGRIYVCNGSGQIISHTNKSLLGASSEACSAIPADTANGSIKMNNEQIVYYQVSSSDWTMVKEVPINEFIEDIFNLRFQMLWILGVSFAAAFIASALWIKKITRPMHNLMEAMGNIEKGKFDFTIEDNQMNEFGRLSSGFNRMSFGIRELIEQNRMVENEKIKVEIQMLQSQINPHFLFNTLNTIKWMAVVNKSDNITKSITALCNLLRPIFKNPAVLCTLKEELEYADHYITILNYRYGEGIEIEYAVVDEALSCTVPRFILQPIIENAILHGFEYSGYAGKIRIEVEELPSFIVIRVIDNGRGMSDENLRRVKEWMESHKPEERLDADESAYGIGLANVYRRIRLNFPKSPGLDISRLPSGGTRVDLFIPKS
ncbi:sensor histidine kinase [Paenibacillus sp. PAMC21692]|uniref:cache domain-containing sensor histidine kinase n=1 Tax=Paenibacillus sp. PAMC21692 TaxID=2762320 RepID=UPI00164EC2B7|nr:sensor histidine kinase [Paenibacillus sp. PAMC21692]QNK58614.1 sensor histidine kinase [Paenibacillus sp. PAMC21692]